MDWKATWVLGLLGRLVHVGRMLDVTVVVVVVIVVVGV